MCAIQSMGIENVTMVDIDKIVQINIARSKIDMRGFVEFIKKEIGVPTFLCIKDEIYYNVGIEKLREEETKLYLKHLLLMYKKPNKE